MSDKTRQENYRGLFATEIEEKTLEEIRESTNKAWEKQAFWQQVVKNTEKRKAITLRLQNRDITRLKAIARRKGLPYQTFIASALHQLANGDLIERWIKADQRG